MEYVTGIGSAHSHPHEGTGQTNPQRSVISTLCQRVSLSAKPAQPAHVAGQQCQGCDAL